MKHRPRTRPVDRLLLSGADTVYRETFADLLSNSFQYRAPFGNPKVMTFRDVEAFFQFIDLLLLHSYGLGESELELGRKGLVG